MTSSGAGQAKVVLTPLHFLTPDSGLQPEGLHPAHGVAFSGFRPLEKILDCSLP